MLHVATPSPRLLQQKPLCGMPPWISFRAATSCRPLRSHVTGDTLGWVEFADGNVDKALKYILAAWQLSEGAEVADHLGQIYAKRGDTEKAEYFYAVSLNARRPLPETKQRLSAFLGGDEKVSGFAEKYHSELDKLRMIPMSDVRHEGDARADFFVVLRPGSSAAMVEGGQVRWGR